MLAEARRLGVSNRKIRLKRAQEGLKGQARQNALAALFSPIEPF